MTNTQRSRDGRARLNGIVDKEVVRVLAFGSDAYRFPRVLLNELVVAPGLIIDKKGQVEGGGKAEKMEEVQ